MKHILQKTWLMLCLLFVGIGTGWAEDVTYTITSKSAVSTSGTAPSGSSATFANTYSTKDQITKPNTMTLTLSGYAGKKITGITLSMRSNGSAGAGYLSVKAGTTTLASIGSSDSGVAFNNASWNGSYTTTYTNVTPTMSNTSYAIQNGENVVIVIGCTTNSLYCQSFKITYSDAGGSTTSQFSYTLETVGQGTVTFKDGSGNVVAQNQKVNSGTKLTPTFEPATGYEFTSWEYYTSAGAWSNVSGTEFTITKDVKFRVTYTETQGGGDEPGGNENITKLSADNDADIKFVSGSSSTTGAFWANSTPLTANNLTLSGSNGSSSSYSYYDGSVVRFYQNNTFTITPSNGATITKIEIVRQSTTGSNGGTINCSGLTASSENTSTNTNVYTGSATSAVTFTNTAQARFTKILVYTNAAGPAQISNLIKTSSADLYVGDEIADLKTYLNLPNDYAGTVTFSTEATNVTLVDEMLSADAAGTATINVTAAANGNYLETTGTITLNISKKTPVIAWTNGTKESYTIFNGKDYGFSSYPTAYLTNSGPSTINYSISGDAIIVDGEPAWESAGTYVVKAQTAETDEYNASNVLTYTINVVDPAIKMTPESGTVSAENPTVTFTGNGVKIAYMDDEANENQKTGTSISTNATETSTYYVTIYDDAENEFEHDFDVFVLQNAGLAFSAATQVVSMDDEPFAALTLTNPHDLTVTYSMDITNDLATSIATIDPETGVITLSGKAATTAERKAYVIATTESDGTYAAGEARYELIINKRESNVAWSANEVTVDFDETANLPTLSNPRSLNITYDSSNKDVATISNEGVVTLLAAGTTTISASIGGSAYYDAATYEYTLTVAPKYTVTFNVNGDETGLREETTGAGVTAPAVEDVADYTFAGWASAAVAEETTDAQTFATITAGKYMPTNNTTLYAVYKRVEEGEGGSSDEGEFLIYANVDGTNYYMATAPQKASGSSILNEAASTKDRNSAFVYNIEKTDDGKYTFSFVEGGETKYVIAARTGTSGNYKYYLQSSTTLTDEAKFSLEEGVKGTTRVNSKYNNQCLAFRATDGSKNYNVFRIYNTSNFTNDQVKSQYFDLELEQVSGGSTTYYTSMPTNTTAAIAITTKEGYSTFVSKRGVVLPDGVKGAAAESENGSLKWNWMYQPGNVVPANTPILVKGTKGEHTANYATGGDEPTTNYLYANLSDVTKAASEIATGADKFYTLSYNKSGENLGFYWRVAEGASFDVPSMKVFLALPSGTSIKSFYGFDDEDATGIESMSDVINNNDAIFNLAGQRVNKAQKGIYIVNGKKVLVK